MSNSAIDIKEIRNKFIQGIIFQFLPGLVFNWLEQRSESLLEAIKPLIGLFGFFMFLYGYGLCFKATNDYAQYKGYKNHFYIYSILNVFGLSILFLLNNRNLSETTKLDKEPLLNFSISSIFISFFAITVVLTLPALLIAFYIAGAKDFVEYSENEDFLAILNISVLIIFVWYFIREFKRSNINYQYILGSFREIDFKLPVGLTIIKYFFCWGINPITLYGLSFVIPQYVENQINEQNATTIIGWLCYGISALFFAPIMEELIFRGIFLQKLAIQKNIIRGLVVSAIAFTIMHFRYDVIPLFITGIIYALLYLKTKQLAVPILCHFLYNLIAVVIDIYYQYFSGVDPSVKITVAEYQQQFLDKWELNILFVVLSAPYLAYFIYKNFPRNYDIQRLPYFANQTRL